MIHYLKLRKQKVHKFEPKVLIHSERGSFILKTITSSEELVEALRLRYEVFHHEMLGKTKSRGIDVDEYDRFCDHLAIIDKKTQKIVGTYRLNCSLFSNQFYSSNEFYLRNLFEAPGTKIELGRACIHKNYRRGIVISLLWRGIAEYMNATKASWLFGCASIKVENPRQSALLFRYFEQEGRLEHSLLCPPTPAFAMNQLGFWIERLKLPLHPEERAEAETLIPPLAKAYLNAGALVAGEPAYDPDFHCIDFLTILPQENLNKALWRKYGVWEKNPTEAESSYSMKATSEVSSMV